MHSDFTDTQANGILTSDPELASHLEALGLESVEEYTRWCARHGFSTRIEKHWRERGKERYFAAHDAIKDRLNIANVALIDVQSVGGRGGCVR